jgi:acylphosphatase
MTRRGNSKRRPPKSGLAGEGNRQKGMTGPPRDGGRHLSCGMSPLPNAQPASPPIRVRVTFSGRVQGVGFRATVRDRAEAVPGITGWVRNEPDGTVLAEIQGERAKVDDLLDGIHSDRARHITGSDVARIEVVPGEAGFAIVR